MTEGRSDGPPLSVLLLYRWLRHPLDRVDFLRLRALGAAASRVLHPLVLVQGAETVDLNGGVVDEDVGRAVVRGDEAIALVRVEPLHSALRHVLLLLRRFREPRAWLPGLPAAADTRGQNFAGAVTRTRTSRNRVHLTTHSNERDTNRQKWPVF